MLQHRASAMFGALIFALVSLPSFSSADHMQSISNPAANGVGPVIIPYNNTAFVGPDGPWQVLSIPMGYNDTAKAAYTHVNMFPLRKANATLLIVEDACSTSSCVRFTGTVMEASYYNNAAGWKSRLWSSQIEAPENFDPLTATFLNLTGQANWGWDRMFLGGSYIDYTNYVDYSAQILSTTYQVNYPSTSFTPIALFGMGYGRETIPNSYGGTQFANSTMWAEQYPATNVNITQPSNSYGLHVGSAALGLNGSLLFGGYDQTRVISDPISYPSGVTPRLTGISLASISSNVPVYNNTRLNTTKLLQSSKGQAAQYIDVEPLPSAPYMYLPRATCDAFTDFLPVYYNASFNLYLWNTSHPTFIPLTTTTTYLQFNFTNSSGFDTTINIPIALLNLNLTQPLVRRPTPYFPCSPRDEEPYALGRSFLQGAFLGESYDQNVLWLAQSSGPQGLSSSSMDRPNWIYPNTTIVSAAPQTPEWQVTWSGVLEDYEGETFPTIAQDESSSSSLSGGAIAGIVVGVVAGLALTAVIAFFAFRRRRRAGSQAVSQDEPIPPYGGGYSNVPTTDAKWAPQPTYEAPNDNGVTPMSMPMSNEIYEVSGGNQHPQSELAGKPVDRQRSVHEMA